MMTPSQVIDYLKMRCKKNMRIAFYSALIIGILVHMPVLVGDFPNHDGLDSMYFDQNMITSGRWFLTVACGFSSYFSIPWLIGLLGIVYLGVTSALMTDLLDLSDEVSIVLVSGLLVSFPALASTFSYVFTLDGYMLAMLLAVAGVWLTKRYSKGFIPGGICLGFSLGIYQAYLPFAMILCLYLSILVFVGEGQLKSKCLQIIKYLCMGIIGMAFYGSMLFILLKIQGKQLASYQGINGDGSSSVGITERLGCAFRDFAAFVLKGRVLANNVYSYIALGLLAAAAVIAFFYFCTKRKLWKKWELFVIMGVVIGFAPVLFDYILVVTPRVTYHLLMRYHFVMLPVLALSLVSVMLKNEQSKCAVFAKWCAVVGVSVLVFNFAVTDNIAYSNLQKKYEKTYGYCMRLLDRIEQTPGYYPGIPIAMIGVVSDEQYPLTDLTGQVTDPMIGMNGDYLLYTGDNYEKFIRHFLGATLNVLEPEAMETIYYSDEYVNMDSFPGPDSVKIVDGIMYIKTENRAR